MTAISTPHDAFFKVSLGNPEIALAFFRHHLPQALQSHCDLSTLQLNSSSFIDEDWRYQYSDRLYSVQTREGAGYLYVLVEHQSSPNKLMAFRLLRYCLAAMQKHLDEHKGNCLPLVVPLLFYHGETSPYPYSMDWLDCFSNRELAESVYLKPLPLVDITIENDEAILKREKAALFEIVQRDIFRKEINAILTQVEHCLRQDPISQDYFHALVTYLLHTGRTPVNQTAQELIPLLLNTLPQYQENIMTLAELLKQEGHQQGMQQGMQQGIERGIEQGLQEGRQEEKEEIARKLLAQGLDLTLIKTITGLSNEDIEAIKQSQH